MKKFLNVPVFIIILAMGIFFSGCKGKSKKAAEEEPVSVSKKTDHAWYYFTQDGFAKTDSPSNSPFAGSLPYTEAIRISSANNTFAVVNRLGMLCFDGKNISIAKDISVFSERTAGNLVFMNNKPVFSVYKSSFFNDTISSTEYKKDASAHLFLVQFDPESNISYPLINCSNLSNDTNCEVTDFYWDGTTWFCCLKSLEPAKEKTSFSYIKFTPSVPLLSITPVSAANQISIEECSVNEFRDVMRVKDYSEAPERIKKMLQGFSKEIPFSLEVKSEGGVSPRIYENLPQGVIEQELNAKAIISQSWSAALFQDGTLYIEGALPGKHILRGGKAVAIRLPKLPEGYIYSDFLISGTMLYAAWEETDFYKVRRSGFLSVDLDSTLYSKLR